MSDRSRTGDSTGTRPPGTKVRPQQGVLPPPLAAMGNEADRTWTASVVEANEQLILTSLHAQELAQSAVHDLDALTRARQHDEVTGTPNRALMLDRLEHAIAIASRNAARIAVMFIDLDDFKQVNDTHGHDVGDDVLRAAARRLESAVRASDTVSRHGGDEFLVLLSEISHTSDAVLIAKKILAAFSRPVRAGAELVFMSASIGIAVFPDDGADASALIHCADTAMYRSKRGGHGRYALHSDQVSQPKVNAGPPGSSQRAVASQTAARVQQRSLQEQEKEHQHAVHVLREANANLVAAAMSAAQVRDIPIAPTSTQLALQASVAEKLSSAFTPRREAIELLHQIHSSEPLLQLLIQKQIASWSAPTFDSFGGSRMSTERAMSYETRKTGEFEAIAEDGSRLTVFEFIVTAHRGALDQKCRASTEKSYGLANGERVERLSRSDFRLVDSGMIIRRP